MSIKKIIVFLFIVFLIIFFFEKTKITKKNKIISKEKTYHVKITKIIEEKEISIAGEKNFYQKIETEVFDENKDKNKKIIIETTFPYLKKQKYKINDKLIISSTLLPNGKTQYFIKDYVRNESLIFLFLIFFVLSLLIAGIKGILSFISMFFSFFMIFNFILPKIYIGEDPLRTIIIAIIIIIPINFFLSHGFNKKTLSAIIGTIISLIFTGFLANIFIEKVKITGFSSEEINFLQIIKKGEINIPGLLLAGIIISILGVLDDVNISQSSIVFKLKEINKNLKLKDLYQKSMEIGREHILATINTLILVYTGSSLPLLLLFLDSSISFYELINYEIIAEEILKTLITSIGLIISIPLTTFIASIIAFKTK